MAEKLPCEVYAQVYVAKMRVLETQIKWAFLAFSGGLPLRHYSVPARPIIRIDSKTTGSVMSV